MKYIREIATDVKIKIELQIKCVELEKCSECNLESVSNKLYIKTTKPYNFYFDTENKDYEPCYETSFK